MHLFRAGFFRFSTVVVLAACGGRTDEPTSGASTDQAAGESNEACCPRDAEQSGSMRLGGPRSNGCFVTHDFWCTTDWRVETDEHGCDVWRYDSVPGCTPGGGPPPDAG